MAVMREVGWAQTVWVWSLVQKPYDIILKYHNLRSLLENYDFSANFTSFDFHNMVRLDNSSDMARIDDFYLGFSRPMDGIDGLYAMPRLLYPTNMSLKLNLDGSFNLLLAFSSILLTYSIVLRAFCAVSSGDTKQQDTLIIKIITRIRPLQLDMS